MGYESDLPRLAVDIEKIRQRMNTQGKRRAVLAGARVIAAAMTAAAPVLDATTAESTSLEPGEMKANIKARVRQTEGEPVGLAGPSGGDGRVPKAAYLVEYGHRMVKGGKSRLNSVGQFVGEGEAIGDVPPHPFLRPGFESSVTSALEAMGEAMGETLKESGR